MHVPTMLGSVPGVFAVLTRYMNHKMEKNDVIPQVADIVTVGELYALAARGGIIFT